MCGTSNVNFAVSSCSRPVCTTRPSRTRTIQGNSPESRKRHRQALSKEKHRKSSPCSATFRCAGGELSQGIRAISIRGRALHIRGGSRTQGVALPTPSFRRLSVGADFLSTSADTSLAGPDPHCARLHAGCLPHSRSHVLCVRHQDLQGGCGGGPEPRRQGEQSGGQAGEESARVLRPPASGHRRRGQGPGGAGHQEAPGRGRNRESQGEQSAESRREGGRGEDEGFRQHFRHRSSATDQGPGRRHDQRLREIARGLRPDPDLEFGQELRSTRTRSTSPTSRTRSPL